MEHRANNVVAIQPPSSIPMRLTHLAFLACFMYEDYIEISNNAEYPVAATLSLSAFLFMVFVALWIYYSRANRTPSIALNTLIGAAMIMTSLVAFLLAELFLISQTREFAPNEKRCWLLGEILLLNLANLFSEYRNCQWRNIYPYPYPNPTITNGLVNNEAPRYHRFETGDNQGQIGRQGNVLGSGTHWDTRAIPVSLNPAEDNKENYIGDHSSVAGSLEDTVIDINAHRKSANRSKRSLSEGMGTKKQDQGNNPTGPGRKF